LQRLQSGTRAEVRLPESVLLAPEMILRQDEPQPAETVPARPLVDRPLRPSRMQYWAGTSPDGRSSPLPLPRFQDVVAPADVAGDGRPGVPGALQRRVPGALLFPGTMRPVEQPEARPINQSRPDEIRRSLSSLRRGVEHGRSGEPAPAFDA